MKTLDLRKDLNYLYTPSAKKVSLVEVPRFQFAMLNGEIEPGHGPGTSPTFQEAMMAMYGVSYTLKFNSKLRKADPIDYPVMALEGLWWVEDQPFVISDPTGWKYILLMLQPDHITAEMFVEAIAQLRKKRGDQEAFGKLRLEPFHEGLCVQVMHLGPYSTEMETIARMDAFAAENGLRMHGKHHEIYLGDPRKAAPEKLKTVLRHPVEKVA